MMIYNIAYDYIYMFILLVIVWLLCHFSLWKFNIVDQELVCVSTSQECIVVFFTCLSAGATKDIVWVLEERDDQRPNKTVETEMVRIKKMLAEANNWNSITVVNTGYM